MKALRDLPSELARRYVLPTKESAAFVGLSVTTFRRLRSRGTIPAPIQLSDRRLGWRIGDLMDWQDCRAAGREWQASLAGNDNRQQTI